MFTRMLIGAAAVAALPGMALAQSSGNPAVVRAVKYTPVVSELHADEYFASTSRVFHRRPCPPNRSSSPSPRPKPPCKEDCDRVKCPEVEIGSIVTAPTNFLGNEAGHVLMKVGYTTFECAVIEWCHNSVRFQIPNMGLAKGLSAELELVRPDGTIVRCYRICLVPKPGLIVQPVIGASPAADPRHTFNAAETHGLELTSAVVQPPLSADPAGQE